MNDSSYQLCIETVMDTIGDPDIRFDEKGVCQYYYTYLDRLKKRVPEPKLAKEQLERMVAKIKKEGKGRPYDCIIGVSGGVDSTYTAWLVKQLGLRPLAVHLDNGWDSELAVKNIENILKKLNIDLYTEVLDWDMFKDLQLSFLKASTPDGEIPTDHAILAILYKVASQHGVKYIISGMNFRNEGFLPPSWARGYLDWKYIRSVHQRFGYKRLVGYPHLSVIQFLYYNVIKGIRSVSFLNYVPFDKVAAIDLIEKELGWRNYGGKHYESIYTRFYQSYILPRKFNIDKRKAHLTCLILSGSGISRDEALNALKQPTADLEMTEQDKVYVMKKLELTLAQFEEIMNTPIKSINDYPNNHSLEMKFRRLLNWLREKGIMPN
jgi:N-acetyl sugar amidotransferase